MPCPGKLSGWFLITLNRLLATLLLDIRYLCENIYMV